MPRAQEEEDLRSQLGTMPTREAIELLAKLWTEGRDDRASSLLASFRRYNNRDAVDRVEQLARRLFEMTPQGKPAEEA